MPEPGDTLIILTPAFAAGEDDNWLPSQAVFVRSLSKLYPALKVIILTFRYPVHDTISRYSWHGSSVIALGNGKTGKLASVLLWKHAWSEIRRINRTHTVAGIFSFFCGECAFVGHHFAKRYALKHHIWILGQDARAGNSQVRRIKPLDTELIAISDFLVREFYRNYHIRPAYTIPIGIDPEIFPPVKPQRTIDLLGAGSLSRLKQYDIFIEVVAAIAKEMPQVSAAICGGGTEQDTLQELISERHLGSNLRLPGEQSHNATLAFMQQSKILLHPSSYEGFGMVCTEALYAGAHVISFCRPMDAPVAHWHIVADKEEMIVKALELLRDEGTLYTSVIPFKMQDTVAQIMRLYGYDETSG